MTTPTPLTICKTAVLVMSGLLLLAPFRLPFAGTIIFLCGLVILASALACLSDAYKKPVYAFLALSVLTIYYYRLPLAVLVPGVSSMLPLVAIVAVLQLFIIPLKVGRYDQYLKNYLLENFKTGGTLHMFVSLVAHLLGALLGFGANPLAFSIFHDGARQIVDDHNRFLVTAVSRGFSLSTLWAPGVVSVMLVLQATGAPWFQVFIPAAGMALLGILTSALIESRSITLKPLAGGGADTAVAAAGGTRKIAGLLLVIAAVILLIVLMEQARILTSTTRILTAGFTVAILWIACCLRQPATGPAWREYWGKALNGMPGLAALFISVGLFSEIVDQTGLMARLLAGLTGGAGLPGGYLLLLVPPLLILLSFTGVHPFISLLLIGKILSPVVAMPHHEVLLALALLLGGSLSYTISPFAGTILTLSTLAGCSPGKAALKWNGPFAAIFLLEGLAALLILQWLWR